MNSIIHVKGVQRSGTTMLTKHYITYHSIKQNPYLYKHTSVDTLDSFSVLHGYVIQDHSIDFYAKSKYHNVESILVKRKVKSKQILSWFVIDFLEGLLDDIEQVYSYQKEDSLPQFELSIQQVKDRCNSLIKLETEMENTFINNNIEYKIKYYEDICNQDLLGQTKPTKARPENLIKNYNDVLNWCKKELNEVL